MTSIRVAARPAPFEADLVADDAADFGFRELCHAAGGAARGNAPWLEHEDPPTRQPGLVEQRQGHDGGLARSGWRRQYPMTLAQCLAQCRQGFGDRVLFEEGGIHGEREGWKGIILEICLRDPGLFRPPFPHGAAFAGKDSM